jgi:DHA1 family multidrug resistance protein-like MFS transporter
MNAATIAASLLALFVVALGYGVLVPLAPDLAARSMAGAAAGSTSLHTGAMSFVYLGSFAVFAPAWAYLAPALPSRAKAVIGLAGFGMAFGLLSSVPAIGVRYAVLAAAGASAAAVVPALQGQMSGLASEKARGRMVALFSAASFAGWFTGPVLASWGRAIFGPDVLAWSFAFVGALGVMASIAVATCMPAASAAVGSADQRARGPLSPADTRRAAIAAMVVTFGVGSFEVSLVLWGVQVLRLDPAVLARMLLECTVVMMAVQVVVFLAPAMLPRWRPATAAASFALMALALAIVPLDRAAWVAFAAVAMLAVSATLLQAMLTLHAVTRDSGSGRALGLQLGFANGGQALGSLGAGALFDATGASFYAAAGIIGAAALWSLRAR